MNHYKASGSITKLDHIEDIYTHIIEDFVGSCTFSKCEVTLRHLPGNDQISLRLGQREDFKTVDFRIGTNWIRNGSQYRAHLEDIFTHIAREEPDFLLSWVDRVRNRSDLIRPIGDEEE